MHKDYSTGTVLVVEDNQAVRSKMLSVLRLAGCNVDCAADGLSAVRTFETNKYCLIFMGIQIPQMNGLQATAAIRSYEHEIGAVPVPIIATTDGAASRQLCFAVGMTDYLETPVDDEKLMFILDKWTRIDSNNELALR